MYSLSCTLGPDCLMTSVGQVAAGSTKTRLHSKHCDVKWTFRDTRWLTLWTLSMVAQEAKLMAADQIRSDQQPLAPACWSVETCRRPSVGVVHSGVTPWSSIATTTPRFYFFLFDFIFAFWFYFFLIFRSWVVR